MVQKISGIIDSNSAELVSPQEVLITNHKHLYGDLEGRPVATPAARKMDIRTVDPIQLKREFYEVITGECSSKKLAVNEELRKKLNQIFVWQMDRFGVFVHSEYERIDPEKGLICCGRCGTGKSMIMRSLRRWQITLNAMYIVPDDLILGSTMLSERGITDRLKRGQTYSDMLYRVNGLYIDDFGRIAKINDYGTQMYPTVELVEEFYELWDRAASIGQHMRQTLYATTNLMPNKEPGKDTLLAYLGAKAYDRIRQMCVLLNFDVLDSYRCV